MIRFELQKNTDDAIQAGYPKMRPVALADSKAYSPLVDYIIMLEYYYIRFRQGNNIDNWLDFIDRQIYAKDNEEYFGDNVCVFFEGGKAKVINYWDYENGNRDYCEISAHELRKLTVDWKWFVIDWEIKMMKGEL